MKKTAIILLTLLFFSVAVIGQSVDRSTETIQKYYKDVAEKARLCETDDDRGQFGELFMNELVVNKRDHQWRAVGIYNQKLKFFYKGGDSEAKPYPDQLIFAVFERRLSNQRFREEWLFSDTGELMLFTYKAESEESQNESRIYYSRGKAIRTVDGKKVTDRLSALDRKYTTERAAQGKRIKELFAKSISL